MIVTNKSKLDEIKELLDENKHYLIENTEFYQSIKEIIEK